MLVLGVADGKPMMTTPRNSRRTGHNTITMASKLNKNQQQQQTAGKAAHPAQHSSEQTSSHGKNAAHGANAQSTQKAGADKQQQDSGASASDRANANKQRHNQSKKNSGSHPQKVDGHH
ncbi:hypothetical protein BGZ75_010049 [Mortierella antarctica]|nr:hypothetical protein BGZ75_010049 [Mortierella antarctica]